MRAVPLGMSSKTTPVYTFTYLDRWLSCSDLRCFGTIMLSPVFTIFQVDKLHMTAHQIVVLTFTGTLATAVTYPLWGKP